MAKFITRFLKFFFIFFAGYVFLLLTIIFLNKLLLNSCNLKSGVSAVIVGDSHTMWSIDADDIENVQNISLNAEGYIYSYAKLKHVLKNEPGISKVYLGMSYHNFSGFYDRYIYGSILKHFFHRYIGILSLDDYLKIIKSNPRNIPELSRKILREGGAALIKGECTIYGSFPEEKMMEELDYTQLEKRINDQFYRDGEVINVSDINILYLNKIIDLCKEKQLEIVILSTPIHPEYKNMIPENYVKLYDQFINENQLSLYDFSDLVLPDSCYLPDADHVNYYGALLTTEKFKNYHENIKNDL